MSDVVNDLSCNLLHKQFDDFVAVDKLSFEVESGSFFSILGPSGCGKTTLLRMLAGFEQASSGDIFIKNARVNDVAPNHRPLNMVFQHLALFPNMSVAENIAYGLKRRKVGRSEREQKIKRVLQRVGLDGSEHKGISQLSGGQKQRIAIARCLVLEPSVLLLDEPLGALDLKLREHMKVELKHLQQEFGTTFVYITHDQSEALVMSDKVAVMNHGRFEQVDTPQRLYANPHSSFVAKFVGNTNVVRGRIGDVGANSRAKVELGDNLSVPASNPQDLAVGSNVELFLRPEAIELTGDATASQISGVFKELLFDGANSTVIVQTSVGDLQVRLPQQKPFELAKGSVVYLSWSSEQCFCLAAENN
ncbi:ABC transporter ATP-binding protein [Alginatibacterium sediminis]|uniref:ABC transporter ATP-binding protein n=1 Tax=Alginatibacterium sediminis TaxID=2164068 RepID=A0A420E8G1_9ALTE|nr:ABC transporter ATP-binding protein [Alginatibacterium sediminis]RKF15608.1 ABC transporter ATP-binding protein [Alginatibacterium sediminis]